MSRQLGRFEAGRILLPSEAPWLADFEKELLDFPGGRYDDQVDALLLFLEWFAQNEHCHQPMTFCAPDHRSARVPLELGCPDARRMVAAMVKRICWIHTGQSEPIIKRQISLIATIVRLDFPDHAAKIPCSFVHGISS